jgi:hypothetical protein
MLWLVAGDSYSLSTQVSPGERVRRDGPKITLVEVDLHIKVAWLGSTESSRLALHPGLILLSVSSRVAASDGIQRP